LHYRRGKMVQLIGKPDPKTIQRAVNMGNRQKTTPNNSWHIICAGNKSPKT
jgi:hypothetical protein